MWNSRDKIFDNISGGQPTNSHHLKNSEMDHGISLPETSKGTWKSMVGILISFWGGPFSGVMLVLGSVILMNF